VQFAFRSRAFLTRAGQAFSRSREVRSAASTGLKRIDQRRGARRHRLSPSGAGCRWNHLPKVSDETLGPPTYTRCNDWSSWSGGAGYAGRAAARREIHLKLVAARSASPRRARLQHQRAGVRDSLVLRAATAAWSGYRCANDLAPSGVTRFGWPRHCPCPALITACSCCGLLPSLASRMPISAAEPSAGAVVRHAVVVAPASSASPLAPIRRPAIEGPRRLARRRV